MHSSKSSGCTPSAHPIPSSASSGRPENASHELLKNEHWASGSAIHRSTGEESAIARNRCSVSARRSSSAWRSRPGAGDDHRSAHRRAAPKRHGEPLVAPGFGGIARPEERRLLARLPPLEGAAQHPAHPRLARAGEQGEHRAAQRPPPGHARERFHRGIPVADAQLVAVRRDPVEPVVEGPLHEAQIDLRFHPSPPVSPHCRRNRSCAAATRAGASSPPSTGASAATAASARGRQASTQPRSTSRLSGR